MEIMRCLVSESSLVIVVEAFLVDVLMLSNMDVVLGDSIDMALIAVPSRDCGTDVSLVVCFFSLDERDWEVEVGVWKNVCCFIVGWDVEVRVGENVCCS